MWYRFRPYVSVASRRARAAKKTAELIKQGRVLVPVQAERKIAKSFWGQAWCKHLESYSDYANRLPRGRTYARNGSVLDLQIHPGQVDALVQGSELYTIQIKIERLPANNWANIKARCAGEIGSIIELLQGHLSDSAMAIITHPDGGMFPAPRQISMSCSCPDIAGLCKHLAAVLYCVGARLDTQPELLFKLRQVDHLELIPTADALQSLTQAKSSKRRTLESTELADVFGVELDPRGGPEAGNKGPKMPAAKPDVVPQAAQPPAAAVSKKSAGRTKNAARSKKRLAVAKPGKNESVVEHPAGRRATRQPQPRAGKGRR